MEQALTSKKKDAILAEWERTQATPLPSGHLAGRGYPDREMLPWCERVNALPGICTLQSCAGHTHEEGYLSSGVLWLRLSPPLMAAFRAHVHRLAQDEHIERVSVIFFPTEEIVDITFRGNERDLLDESMQVILSFLESVVDSVIWG